MPSRSCAVLLVLAATLPPAGVSPMQGFSATERRRSRTYPATGYAASPVLKVCKRGAAEGRRAHGCAEEIPLGCAETRSDQYKVQYKVSPGGDGFRTTGSTPPLRSGREADRREGRAWAAAPAAAPPACARSSTASSRIPRRSPGSGSPSCSVGHGRSLRGGDAEGVDRRIDLRSGEGGLTRGLMALISSLSSTRCGRLERLLEPRPPTRRGTSLRYT